MDVKAKGREKRSTAFLATVFFSLRKKISSLEPIAPKKSPLGRPFFQLKRRLIRDITLRWCPIPD
jgi:hypothetical protein